MIEMELSDDESESIIQQNTLVDVVFSWSFEDVLNKDLYKDKVQPIPVEFQSIPSYMRAFVFPLIEETHAELSSSIDTVSNAFTYSLMSIEAENEMIEYDEPCRIIKYTIEIEEKEIENDAVSRELETGDLIAITDVRPKCVDDLNRPTVPYHIALIEKVTNKKDYIQIQILSSKPILLEQGSQIIRENNTLFAVYLMNIVTNIRIWTALQLVPEGRNLKIIEKVLQPDSTSKERCSQCLKNGTYYASKCQVLASTRSMNLNESQQEAIEKCFAMKYCHHESTTKLIWGPPGTGKTKTICALLFALLSQKCRTLTCGPTNISVVEVASRLLRPVMESLDSLYYGYGLGDVVLFGNKKRMKLNDESELVHVFLDHRVEVLKRCLAPRSGWSHLLDSLVCLIQDPEQQFQLYLMNGQDGDFAAEFDHGEESDEDNNDAYGFDGAKDKGFKNEESKRIWQEVIAKTLKLSKKESRTARQGFPKKKSFPKKGSNLPRSRLRLNFADFLIKKFNCKAEAMKFCIVNLLSHLPTSLLSMGVAKDMTKALKSLGNLHSLLHSFAAASGNLREVLVKTTGEQRNASRFTELELVKDECLQILKSLPRHFFDNVDGFSIREQILENSCLLFCTVSSSIKLFSTEVELLVIDEAAQLKECESTIPLQIPGLRHAMLFGDDQQLPALVKSEICNKIGFGRSLFQRLASLGCQKHLLCLQYRMHPSIILFPNKVFYQNRILDAPNVKSESYQKRYLQGDMYGNYSFIDVRCGNEEVISGHKYRNMIEVAVVCEVVANLFQACAMLKQKVTVGIISPYAAQVDAIKESLGTAYSRDDINFSVDVRTVDGFQGGEKDIIIISTVRSNGSGSVGFLTSSQRVNVALTRARYALWIFGNGTTLRSRNSVWRQVVNDAKSRQCYYDACEDRNLAKAMAVSLIDVDILDIKLYLERQLFKNAKCQVSIHENFWKSMARMSNKDVRKKAISLVMKLSDDWHPHQNNHVLPLSVYEIDGLAYILATFDTIKEDSIYTGIINVWDIRPSTNNDQDPMLKLCWRFAALSLND